MVVPVKHPILALSILYTYSRVSLLLRRLERSRGERRAALQTLVQQAQGRLTKLQDRYAGQDDLAA